MNNLLFGIENIIKNNIEEYVKLISQKYENINEAELMNLWDNLLPGGYIIFDEYEYHKFDESNGVDRFLKEKKLEYTIKSTNWMAPTAFMIKK